MKRLDPKAVWLFFFLFSSFSLLLIMPLIWVFMSFGRDFNDTGKFLFSFIDWLWFVIPVFLVLSFIWAKLTYRFYRYELTEDSFRKELGVINKKYVSIPYDRIQNINILRPIVSRFLGLSTLVVQTAGASGTVTAEGFLIGLSREVAEELRDELILRSKQSKNQGL